MRDAQNWFAANEIVPAETSLSYQPCNMYILLLMYQINPQHQQFVKIHGTDFTDAQGFCTVSEPTDHCKLLDDKLLDPHKVMLVEQVLAGFKDFARKHNLEAPSLRSNKSVYDKKLLVEVKGSIKRYNKIVNFQKATLKILTKHEIINRVKNQKDHHLTQFLQRLIQNCPKHWMGELNTKYGLNEIIDDIGVYDSQNWHGFLTQENAPTSFPQHHRLLTDLPGQSCTDNSKTNRYVEEVYAEIKKEDLDNTVLSAVDRDSGEEWETTPNEYISCNETSITNEKSPTHPNELLFSQSDFLSTQKVQLSIEENVSVNELKEVIIKGFSPRVSAKYLIKNHKTGVLEITDSFEIYLTIPQFENSIFSVSFVTSEDVLITTLGDPNVRVKESDENTIKKIISDRFTPGKSYKIPSHIYSQFLEGKTHVLASGFKFV